MNWIHLVPNSFHEDFKIFIDRLCLAQVKIASVRFIG